MRRILGWGAAGAGMLLLVVSVLGHFTSLGDYASAEPRAWEAFDPELAASNRNWDDLSVEADRRVQAEGGGRENVMVALYELVAERFTHRAARHTVFSNWVLAGMGVAHPAFAHIRNPATMVRRGHSLFCGQSSYVLLRLARENGIRARHVGLKGHVVMEAWYDDDWHLFDPDLEVMPRDYEGRVLSVESLAQSPDLLEEYYGGHEGDEASMVEILNSRENNTYMSYPPGAWFEWKSNVLYWFERLVEYLKFVGPLALIALGAWLLLGPVRAVHRRIRKT